MAVIYFTGVLNRGEKTFPLLPFLLCPASLMALGTLPRLFLGNGSTALSYVATVCQTEIISQVCMACSSSFFSLNHPEGWVGAFVKSVGTLGGS